MYKLTVKDVISYIHEGARDAKDAAKWKDFGEVSRILRAMADEIESMANPMADIETAAKRGDFRKGIRKGKSRTPNKETT